MSSTNIASKIYNSLQNTPSFSSLRRIKFLKYLIQLIRDSFPKKMVLHGDYMSKKIFNLVIRETKPTAIVETGTYFGWTTEFLAKMFPDIPIYTCEINPRYYKKARKRLKKYSNVNIFFGDSRKFLNIILAKKVLGERPFFYLDAHWGSEWPLKEELKRICKELNSTIIVIDDFKVPEDSRYGFDIYSGEECSLKTILPYLDSNKRSSFLFPKYSEKEAFKPDIKHSPLTGYVIIFQNLEKDLKSIEKNDLVKNFFKIIKN